MTKDIKIVIGSNYGDESKGLMVRHFCKKSQEKTVVVFHNGTAQRGHTIDYNSGSRHVYHHFCSGTAEGIPTFFAKTFWIHPMEFVREYFELEEKYIYPPIAYCDPDALVITPFDMIVDHATEDWIALQSGQREFGSCGFGTWCATDRYPAHVYKVSDFILQSNEKIRKILKDITEDCLILLKNRDVDINKTKYKHYLNTNSVYWKNIVNHFINDLRFFFSKINLASFNNIYEIFDTLIFENGQGLGLDQNVNNIWTTTSNTGIFNPFNMLTDKEGFKAEACYVTRPYITRHGEGPLKNECRLNIVDKTNIFNDLQGDLRFGHLSKDTFERIDKDFSIVVNDCRFNKTIALTHANEFYDNDLLNQATYTSYDKYTVN